MNHRAAEKRKPRSQREGSGKRKSAKPKNIDENTDGDGTRSKSRPRPRPLGKNASVTTSEMDAAELLMGLGTAPTRPVVHNPFDAVVDAVLGISPEESAQLDADQYNLSGEDNEDEDVNGQSFLEDTNSLCSHATSEDNDSDSDEEDYSIIYEVPYKNATRELSLPSTTSFAMFLTALSAKMDVSVTHLSAIGYIPSYKPKNPKPLPKLLETSEDYERMMDDISAYRKGCLAKKGRTVKPFSIRLSDTSETPVDGRSKVSALIPELSHHLSILD